MIQVCRYNKLLHRSLLDDCDILHPACSSGKKPVGQWFGIQHKRCFSLQDHYCIVVAVNDGSGKLRNFGLFRGQQKGMTAPSVQRVILPDAG